MTLPTFSNSNSITNSPFMSLNILTDKENNTYGDLTYNSPEPFPLRHEALI